MAVSTRVADPYQNGGFYQGGGPTWDTLRPYVAQPQMSFPPRVDPGSASPVESQEWVVIVRLPGHMAVLNMDWTQDSVVGS